MRHLIIMLAVIAALVLPASAQSGSSAQAGDVQSSSGPSEVGTTTLAPGTYTITEVATGKTSSLTVTNKGTMILQGAPGTGVPVSSAGSAAVVPGAAAAGAVPQAAGGLQDMVKQGLQQGMTELMKRGTQAPIDKMLK